MQKQTQASVRGLALNPNPLGNLTPGTLAVAENVLMRRPGALQPMPTPEEIELPFGSGAPAVKIFAPWVDEYFAWIMRPLNAASGSALRFSNGSEYTSVSLGTTNRSLRFDPGVSHATVSRTRHIFTEYNSPVCVDHTSDPHGALRVVGLPPPVWVAAGATAAGSTDIPIFADTKFYAYKCVFKRVTADYELVSAPSPPSVVQNTTGDIAVVDLVAAFDPAIDPVAIGDFVVFYKVAQQDTVDALGDDFRECGSYQLTATDLTTGLASFTDLTNDDRRGAQLYSNSLAEGASQVNLMPPSSVDVATYQDTVFYASKNSWPTAALNIPGRFGQLLFTSTAERVHGIGRREFAGNTVLGQHTITNVDITHRQGLAVGQVLTDTGSLFAAGSQISSITGSGPYTLTISGAAASATTTATDFEAADTIQIRATKDGVTTSDTVVFDTGLIGRLAVNLATMTNLRGFRLLVGNLYDDSALYIDGVSFGIWSPIPGQWDSFVVVMTNGQNYLPNEPFDVSHRSIRSVQDTRRNRLFFAKTSLPEAVAPVNWVDVGSETILKIWPGQSALMVFATDGLWRLSGAGNQWTVDQVERTFSLMHPDCVNALDGQIHAWSTDGLAIVTENGSKTYSTDAVGPSIRSYAQTFRSLGLPYIWGPCIACDNLHKEVWLNLAFRDASTNTFYTSFVWNSETGAFTNQTQSNIQGIAYVPYLQAVVTATSTSGTDHAIYKPPSTPTNWLPALVVFNPITAGDAGYLKQWTDVNMLFDNVAFATGSTGVIQLLWDGETSSALNEFTVTAAGAKGLHSWVPRRVALKNQLVFGFKTPLFGFGASTNFDFYGFSLRFRVASETLKR